MSSTVFATRIAPVKTQAQKKLSRVATRSNSRTLKARRPGPVSVTVYKTA